VIERRDGKAFFEILPAGDIVGSHGKTKWLLSNSTETTEVVTA